MTANKLKQSKFKSTKKYQKADHETEESPCVSAIMQTLNYRAIFKYPLSYRQLYTYLITDKEISPTKFKSELRGLCKSRKVKCAKDLFYLPGFNPVNWHDRATNAKELVSEITPVLNQLRYIPWINMISITGAVAALNAPKEDDIDIFIITQKNRLWITRLFVVLICKVNGAYRTEQDFAKKICPNLLVSVDNLEWDKKHRNIYVAHEIAMMRPVYDKDNTYARFISANKWFLDYFAHLKIDPSISELANKPFHKYSTLTNFIEYVLRTMQLFYMRRHRTTETVEKNYIHFDKTDHSAKVLKQYSK